MLVGSTSSYMVGTKAVNEDASSEPVAYETEDEEEKGNDDNGPAAGKPTGALSDVQLATKHRKSCNSFLRPLLISFCSGPDYPNKLNKLSTFIYQPKFPYALR